MECLDHAVRKGNKISNTNNTVTASNTDGYGNLPIVLSIFQTSCRWIDTNANGNVYTDILIYVHFVLGRT
jgi:hypothetical protein